MRVVKDRLAGLELPVPRGRGPRPAVLVASLSAGLLSSRRLVSSSRPTYRYIRSILQRGSPTGEKSSKSPFSPGKPTEKIFPSPLSKAGTGSPENGTRGPAGQPIRSRLPRRMAVGARSGPIPARDPPPGEKPGRRTRGRRGRAFSTGSPGAPGRGYTPAAGPRARGHLLGGRVGTDPGAGSRGSRGGSAGRARHPPPGGKTRDDEGEDGTRQPEWWGGGCRAVLSGRMGCGST